jgi:hypothetical protein
MRTRVMLSFLILMAMGAAAVDAPLVAQEKKDYLSDVEADKIRDAQTPSLRVKLFISFADDRLKKFQYEIGKTTAESRHSDTLNGLLNAYSGCVDDAADTINLATEKQQDVHDAVKEMQTKGKEFLETLEKISKDGRDLDLYKDTLDDAIEGTRDALKDADKAAKQSSPPPVRRKP